MMQNIQIALSLFLPLLLLLLLYSFRSRSRLPPSPISLPIIGHFHLLGPVLHRAFRDLSLRHGPLISLRLGSVPFVIASSPGAAREILKSNELCFTSRLNTVASERITYNYAMAFAPYDTYWKFIRKLTVTKLLGPRPISTFAPLRADECRRFLRRLAAGGTVNLTHELSKLSNGVISKMLLGGAGLDEGRVEEARVVVRDAVSIFGELNLSDFVWFLRKVDVQGFGKRIDEIFARFDSLLERIIGEREELRRKRNKGHARAHDHDQEDGGTSKDYLDILFDYMESPSDDHIDHVELTRLHIKGIIVDLFAGGTDTTAASTEWALAALINHPTALAKAKEEIDRVIGRTRLVTESDIPNLPYIQAVVKEVLRLHPPVPLVMRQCIKQCNIGDYAIPKDSIVVVNGWAIARDPSCWESPLEFKPERFFEVQGNQVEVKGQQFELLPFGSGRRICPGMNMALLVLPTLVASIIQCFDLKVDGTVLSMQEGPGITTPRLHNLVCVPVPRFSSLETILDHH